MADDPLTRSARLHEYSRAANPIGAGITPRVPIEQFRASLHRDRTGSGEVALDVSEQLGVPGPATSPALCASFVRIAPDEPLTTAPLSTSELYYVMAGAGRSRIADPAGAPVEVDEVPWSEGDVFVLPSAMTAFHIASADATLYRVTDEPLLRHLGVAPSARRFEPTLFRAADLKAELARIEASPRALDRNRLSVLLSTEEQALTLTVTHVLWAMYGVVPPGAVQKPHRHQSVALDLIIEARPGCYTLVGRHIDADGRIVDPIRVDWESGGAFITPPGLWHAHHNETDQPAYLLPIQDAGLQTYLRSLDIRFA